MNLDRVTVFGGTVSSPDRMLQMMLVGMASPPVNYTGHCDVMQSNGKIKRMELEDNGHGNTTAGSRRPMPRPTRRWR